jgi:hypothetical protein
MSEVALLRRAVDWALERIATPTSVVGRASAALNRCTEVLEATMWPGAVTHFSGLNGDGFPIEFAFSSRDDYVRFTAEAAAPEVPAEERVAYAEALLEALGAGPPPTALREQIVELQDRGPLVWGAAVSGRHAPSGDRFKLYAEVPSPPRFERLDGELRAARLQRLPRLVMVGWESGSDRLERYFRSDGLAPGELTGILGVVRLGDRARELERAVAEAWQGSAEGALASTWGLSLAGTRDGTCDALSLFKEANRVLGGDARVRGDLLALVEKLGAGMLGAYERVSAPLGDRPGAGAHGMLAFTVARGRPLELRIGLNPGAAFPWRLSRRSGAVA